VQVAQTVQVAAAALARNTVGRRGDVQMFSEAETAVRMPVNRSCFHALNGKALQNWGCKGPLQINGQALQNWGTLVFKSRCSRRQSESVGTYSHASGTAYSGPGRNTSTTPFLRASAFHPASFRPDTPLTESIIRLLVIVNLQYRSEQGPAARSVWYGLLGPG
jgi:hypothetical protein